MKKKNGKKNVVRRLVIITASVLAAIILILTLGATAGLSVFINRHVKYKGFSNDKYPLQDVYEGEDFGLSENILTLKTSDGQELWCSEIAPEKPKAVVIFLTGIEQPSITYFYPHAEMLLEENIASFLLEVRSHGKSTGRKIGLGYTEPEDVKAAVEYISEKEEYRDIPIILWGVSMGGAAALTSFGETEEVDGCIAMSSYASFEDELNLAMKQRNIPEFLRKFEVFFLKQALYINFGREKVDNLSPVKSIQKANGRPVALIACSEDTSVPVENTEILKNAYPEALVWIRDSYEHFIIKENDFKKVSEDTEYRDFTIDFIEKILEG